MLFIWLSSQKIIHINCIRCSHCNFVKSIFHIFINRIICRTQKGIVIKNNLFKYKDSIETDMKSYEANAQLVHITSNINSHWLHYYNKIFWTKTIKTLLLILPIILWIKKGFVIHIDMHIISDTNDVTCKKCITLKNNIVITSMTD